MDTLHKGYKGDDDNDNNNNDNNNNKQIQKSMQEEITL
jgi:hypothetical protein